jgi:hypothetical protein
MNIDNNGIRSKLAATTYFVCKPRSAELLPVCREVLPSNANVSFLVKSRICKLAIFFHI